MVTWFVMAAYGRSGVGRVARAVSLVVCFGVTGSTAGATMDDLATVLDRTSHRASSYDTTGGNLDHLSDVGPGERFVLLDVEGPGRITHMWFTAARFAEHGPILRDLVLRMYWEGADVPAVEVPLGDFFGLGHGMLYPYQSEPVAVGGSKAAMNCYWPMPFYKHARVELYNNGDRSVRKLYYHIDYELGGVPPKQGLFHAMFKQEFDLLTQPEEGKTTGADNYVVLDIEGEGHYVGCFLFVDYQPGGWWGEGDDMIFIDHDEMPTIIGTGTEDYFNNAWGYNHAFSYPYYGAPLVERPPQKGGRTTVYRWHVRDPIRFKEHIRVTIERLYSYHIVSQFGSVAFWYQLEPITEREPLPVGRANWPKRSPDWHPRVEIGATEFEAPLREQGVEARAVTVQTDEGYHYGGWLRIATGGKTVSFDVKLPGDGRWRVEVKPVDHLIDKAIRLRVNDEPLVTVKPHGGHESETPYVELGTVQSADRKVTIHVEGERIVGLDHLRLVRVLP